MWQLKGGRGIQTGNRIGVFLDACLDGRQGRQVSRSDSAGAAAHMDWKTNTYEGNRLVRKTKAWMTNTRVRAAR